MRRSGQLLLNISLLSWGEGGGVSGPRRRTSNAGRERCKYPTHHPVKCRLFSFFTVRLAWDSRHNCAGYNEPSYPVSSQCRPAVVTTTATKPSGKSKTKFYEKIHCIHCDWKFLLFIDGHCAKWYVVFISILNSFNISEKWPIIEFFWSFIYCNYSSALAIPIQNVYYVETKWPEATENTVSHIF